MAFFKFPLPGRKRGDDKAPAAAKRESIEAMRQRAKHRLIGAAVLVAIGVVGFPLLFDTQPRPIAVDVPIEIPDKNQVQPLVIPTPAVTAPAPGAAAVTPAPVAAASAPPVQVPAPASLGAREEVVADARKPRPEPRADKAPAVPTARAPGRAEPETGPKAVARADDGAKVEALLDGKSAAAVPPAGEVGRFVVQVGAFADASKAHEARQKLERTGLKTYTQVVETKDGKRIRVRVGPFASRAEADKAAGKIKALQLAAAILTL